MKDHNFLIFKNVRMLWFLAPTPTKYALYAPDNDGNFFFFYSIFIEDAPLAVK